MRQVSVPFTMHILLRRLDISNGKHSLGHFCCAATRSQENTPEVILQNKPEPTLYPGGTDPARTYVSRRNRPRTTHKNLSRRNRPSQNLSRRNRPRTTRQNLSRRNRPRTTHKNLSRSSQYHLKGNRSESVKNLGSY